MSLQNLNEFMKNQYDIRSNNVELGLPPEYSVSKHPLDPIIKEINENNAIFFDNNHTDTSQNNNYNNYNFEQKSLQGSLEQTPLSNYFFSERNFVNLSGAIKHHK